MLPFDFEPPTQESYWKKRCFQWQDICQQTRKRLRDTQEDQRQMRRRIRELEDQLLSSSEQQQTTTTQTQHGTSTEDDKEDSPAVSQVSVDRPPTMVTIPQNHKCKFYLTDGEALSDEEEYDGDDSWCRDDEEDEEDEDDEDDQSRQQ
jgi:TolA-binding protein